MPSFNTQLPLNTLIRFAQLRPKISKSHYATYVECLSGKRDGLTNKKISTRNSTVFFTNLALWPNGKAFDFESKDSGFDPQRGHQL